MPPRMAKGALPSKSLGHDPRWQVQRRCCAATLPDPKRPKLLCRTEKRPHCQNRSLQRRNWAARSEMNPPRETPLAAIGTRWLGQRERVPPPFPDQFVGLMADVGANATTDLYRFSRRITAVTFGWTVLAERNRPNSLEPHSVACGSCTLC